MKIAIFDTVNNIPGHKQFQYFAKSLVEQGYEVTQFTDADRPSFGGVRVIYYCNQNKWKSYKKIITEFRKSQPDVVISTFSGNKYVDVISYLFSFKWIAFIRSDFFHDRWYNKLRMRKVRRLLVLSTPMISRSETMFPHLKGKVGIMHNSFKYKEVLNFKKENIILHVGGASKNGEGLFVKGTDLLIHAFNSCVRDFGLTAELWIVGDGPQLSELKQLAAGNQLIKFTGRVSNNEVHEMMKKAKVFVLPSRNDAFPNVFLEAMQYGCSLIGTEGTGAIDIIEEGDYGRIVPQVDINALTIAIKELYDHYDFQQVLSTYNDRRNQFGRNNWVEKMSKYISS